MKKHIAEDLPARKHPQASLSNPSDSGRDDGGGDNKGDKTPEQKVKQAVYDIRYRARRENLPLRQAYSQYMQNSSMGESEKLEVRNKLFGKGGNMNEDYYGNVSELASNSVANALYNVFVEKKNEAIDINQLKNELEEAAYTKGDKKYKVRVTDKNGVSYVRYATREKINSLRANPNIESVEMTEYGEPYEGEKKRGEQTAASTSGKDWDKDGKKESPAKEYRGVVHNAIQRKRGGVPDGKDTSSVKEEFLGEVNDETIDQVETKPEFDVMKKSKKNKVTVSPTVNENSYSQFLSMINEKKMTKSDVKKEKKLKKKYDKSGMKASMQKQYGSKKGEEVYFATIRSQAMKEESDTEPKPKKNNSGCKDPREIPTMVSNVKNKLRAMGLKMSYELEGELIDERRREDKGKPRRRRNPVIEVIRKSPEGKGIMTRSGKIVAQHEAERGVPESDRPKEKEETTADRLATKKQRQAAQVASRERAERDEERRRRLA